VRLGVATRQRRLGVTTPHDVGDSERRFAVATRSSEFEWQRRGEWQSGEERLGAMTQSVDSGVDTER
jgi:hypothetical protein